MILSLFCKDNAFDNICIKVESINYWEEHILFLPNMIHVSYTDISLVNIRCGVWLHTHCMHITLSLDLCLSHIFRTHRAHICIFCMKRANAYRIHTLRYVEEWHNESTKTKSHFTQFKGFRSIDWQIEDKFCFIFTTYNENGCGWEWWSNSSHIKHKLCRTSKNIVLLLMSNENIFNIGTIMWYSWGLESMDEHVS